MKTNHSIDAYNNATQNGNLLEKAFELLKVSKFVKQAKNNKDYFNTLFNATDNDKTTEELFWVSKGHLIATAKKAADAVKYLDSEGTKCPQDEAVEVQINWGKVPMFSNESGNISLASV